MDFTKMKALTPFVLCIGLCMGGCSSAPAQGFWAPPAAGVVRDKVAAISIARAVWASMHPMSKVGNDSDWQKEMIAELDGQVWHVHEKPLDHGEIGGGLYIDVSAMDGRILQVVMTQ